MDFLEYQKQAHKTAIYPEINITKNKKDISFIYSLLGLSGETGELIEKCKKIVRNKEGFIDAEDLNGIQKEIGDVLWYLSEISTCFNLSLEKIAINNIEKLRDRIKRNKIKSSGDNR